MIESGSLVPHHEHDVIDDLFNLVKTPSHSIGESEHPLVITLVKYFEGGMIRCADPLDQCVVAELALIRCHIRLISFPWFDEHSRPSKHLSHTFSRANDDHHKTMVS